jgi:hypothetical protein
MTKFLILYRSAVTAQEQMAAGDPEQAQGAMELWMNWAAKAGDALVDLGSPLSTVGQVGGGETGRPIGGFSILQADSADAVTKLLDDHPHLHSPGDPSIEILEFMPIPGT